MSYKVQGCVHAEHEVKKRCFFQVGWVRVPFLFNKAAHVFLHTFQWDSDGVTEQVLVVCSDWSGGSSAFELHSLMSCKVASAQKIHWGHPHAGYFWNEKSTTKRDGINWARCPVRSEANRNSTTWERQENEREMWGLVVLPLRSMLMFLFFFKSRNML